VDEKNCGWVHRKQTGRDEEKMKEGRKRAVKRMRKEDSRFI
jgi:hypothetical protein